MARTEKEKLLRDCASFLDDMFHRSLFSGIQVDLILGQNFKDGPQLYPPFNLGNTVSEKSEEKERDNKFKFI